MEHTNAATGRGIPPKPIGWIKDGECMICTSHGPSGSGYPRVYRGQYWNISRLILFRRHGRDIQGNVARHTCDNRLCINPSHIIIGTMGDNNRDTVERGRHPVCGAIAYRGKSKPWAKLNERQVIEIRALCQTAMPLRQIGRQYGIGLDAVRKIRDRKSWGHLK